MAKLLVLCFLLVLGFDFYTCNVSATVYTVGDNSGWDVSSNLATWTQGKRFVVGDSLLFQYSSRDSVDEVTEADYNTCNTSNPLQTYTSGNTTVQLAHPGPLYFICGNQLYCLGGMKLQVNVQSKQTATSPVAAPQSQPAENTNIPQNPSSKSDNKNNDSPGFVHGCSFVLAFVGFVAAAMVLFV